MLVQASQILADVYIQAVYRINPGQLVNGQRFLTILIFIVGAVAVIYILMVIALVVGVTAAIFNFIRSVAVKNKIKIFYASAQMSSMVAFTVLIVTVSSNNINIPTDLIEKSFLTFAFIQNNQGEGFNIDI